MEESSGHALWALYSTHNRIVRDLPMELIGPKIKTHKGHIRQKIGKETNRREGGKRIDNVKNCHKTLKMSYEISIHLED